MSNSVVFAERFPVRENEPWGIPSDVSAGYDAVLARSIRGWISSLKREL
ncbi:hypothetical protein GCM10010443_93100 [Actinoplanes cyaneus]